ncbi:shikimate kinase [Metabacillus herbersteinensis]|uniref:Shikimate kinase n=1 Tax=Metabacillus herbersteinensis TaxID=283816 RepID=A0ABV6G8I5_9BACI
MKALYLTGFMGAGKTTIGKELATFLNLPVIDTDQQIEEKYQKPVSQIFADQGETTFREYETKILKELPTENVVITTGGGIVLKKENREWMRETGLIIFLKTDLEVILQRLENDESRPLAQNKSKLELSELLKSRLPYYNDCTLTLDTTHKSINEIVEEIIGRIK